MSSDGRKLPWAEPCMPIFGGSFTRTRSGDLNPETGVTTIPHIGAEMWTFFENSNHMFPKFFAACQAGSGWMSEHSNQHVIKTDNVRIRIDENPGLPGSTCKFNSYNSELAGEIPYSQERSFENKPTRVDIQIQAEGCVALNIQIVGDVNMNIKGNVFERIEGDKHETHIGNLYKYHKGDTWENHEGATLKNDIGDIKLYQKGDFKDTVDGSVNETATNGKEETVLSSRTLTVYGRDSETCTVDKSTSVNSMSVKSMLGVTSTTLGNITEQCTEKFITAKNDIQSKSNMGNIVSEALATGPYTDKYTDNKFKFRGGVVNNTDYVNMDVGTEGTINLTQGIF
jgi:hypothetical protein